MTFAQPDFLGPTGYATAWARPVPASRPGALPAQAMTAREDCSESITGVFVRQIELTAKRMELLKEIAPRVTRVVMLSDPFSTEQVKAAENMIDTTSEGWAFHPESMIASPMTIEKRWTKLEVIRPFNASDDSRSRSPRPRGVHRQPSPSCTIRSAFARPAAGRSCRFFRPWPTFEMRVGEAPRRVYTDPAAAWTPKDARRVRVRA
jgi:hypothetical protein